MEVSSEKLSRYLQTLDRKECRLLTGLVVFGSEHNNKNENKPLELLTLNLFDSSYMFRSPFGTIFRHSHKILLLLLNCANMDPYWVYSS
jgi:hypothetical protein